MKSKSTIRTLAATVTLFASLAGIAPAAVNFSQAGNLVTMSVTGESFTVTGAQSDSDVFVAFKNVFSPGGEAVFDSARTAGSMSYSINGGAPVVANWWGGWNFRPDLQGPWTAQDAAFILNITAGTFAAGDVVTFDGSLTVDTTASANATLPADMMADSVTSVLGTGGEYISTPGVTSFNAVPETSSTLLLGLGGVCLALGRRRK